jgi:AraC-like DNA-binding protein
MQTRINIARVGPEAPGQEETRSVGPPASLSTITILNGFAHQFSAYEREGAFSLKWIPRGAARYDVDRLEHRLTGQKVLLLQAGQPYEIEFLDPKGTESFCLFFSEQLVKQALANRELDDLQSAARIPRRGNAFQFADMVFKPPDRLSSILRGLRQSIDDSTLAAVVLEETLLSVLNDIVAITGDHQRHCANIPAKRLVTRRKLLGQLQRAIEMIEDNEGCPPGLDELARASSLSKFHFLRLFTATFALTPMAYADGCRVERGKQLLRHSGLSIGQTAERLGFDSQSAFAKMFRRHVGVTPRVFRAG